MNGKSGSSACNEDATCFATDKQCYQTDLRYIEAHNSKRLRLPLPQHTAVPLRNTHPYIHDWCSWGASQPSACMSCSAAHSASLMDDKVIPWMQGYQPRFARCPFCHAQRWRHQQVQTTCALSGSWLAAVVEEERHELNAGLLRSRYPCLLSA